MSYFLGIDAGVTKTRCVLGTGSDVLARAQADSIEITRVDEASAETNLEAVLSTVATQSGVTLNSIIGICVGLSGIAIPSVAGWVRNALASRVRGHIALCGDEEIALDPAFHSSRGILVIAGTGSHVVGRTANSQLFRTGGWGAGDERPGRGKQDRTARAARHFSRNGCLGRDIVVACTPRRLGDADRRGTRGLGQSHSHGRIFPARAAGCAVRCRRRCRGTTRIAAVRRRTSRPGPAGHRQRNSSGNTRASRCSHMCPSLPWEHCSGRETSPCVRPTAIWNDRSNYFARETAGGPGPIKQTENLRVGLCGAGLEAYWRHLEFFIVADILKIGADENFGHVPIPQLVRFRGRARIWFQV